MTYQQIFFISNFKKYNQKSTMYETFFVLLALKSEVFLCYQQKNVEKILSY